MKDAFLADITEHPDEDAPRLVYADWLEEHGEPERAEFIRVQCALAREPADHPDRLAWLQRQRELLSAHARRWAGRVAELCPPEGYEFHRGFVEAVEVEVEALVKHGPELFRHWPIRAVELVDLSPANLPALVGLPQLARLACLRLVSTFRHAGCQALVGSPYLGGLRGLAIHDTPIGPPGLRALLRSAVAAQLTHLDVGGSGVGREGVADLARGPAAGRLVALDLRGLGLTIKEVRQLDASPALRHLRRLELWYNHLGDAGVAELVNLPLMRRLRYLDLGYNRLSDDGLKSLAASSALSGLRVLVLGVDPFTADGLRALGRSVNLRPGARVEVWIWDEAKAGLKAELERELGDRVVFPEGMGRWDERHLVGWPLWRP